MKIYDKASWHVDAGLSEREVVQKFEAVFSFLDSNNMLSEEGREILELGVDGSVSLHERLLTPEGNVFVNRFYNKVINLNSHEVSSQLLYFWKILD